MDGPRHSKYTATMSRISFWSGLILLTASGIYSPHLTHALTTPMTEIRVSLFGQPCLLQGPIDERSLRTIHSMSPEQLFPQRTTSLASEPTQRALAKVRTIPLVPSGLDRYRERLTKRLEAQLALLQALELFRKDKKTEPLHLIGKKFLPPKKRKEFKIQAEKIAVIKDFHSERARDALDLFFDSYNEGIEADPEEEFHRAIHRMNVQYTCSFEETGEGVADTE